jgi:peptidyl-prolyl cis-trans isomerase A (cyclophilin A)
MFRVVLLVGALGLVPLAGAQDEKKEAQDTKVEAQEQKPEAPEKAPEAQQWDEKLLHPRVKIATTLGDIVLELDAEKAPISVKNFLEYAQADFYAGTIFHRVISTFMIQGGGYTVEMDEKQEGLRPGIRNEWTNGLKNVRGTIAMARKGWRPGMPPEDKKRLVNSATSQFYINVVDNPQLDKPQVDGAAYCVFGKVVDGMDVVDKIKDVEVIEHPKYQAGRAVTPKDPVVINSVTLMDGLDYEEVYREIRGFYRAREKEERPAAIREAAERARDQQAARETGEKPVVREIGQKPPVQDAEEKAKLAKEFQELLLKRADQHGNKLQTTESGLMYVVLEPGDGPSPKPSDVIVANYTGWLLDGTKFDSSYDRGRPLTKRLDELIKGWIEGVGMMPVGAKWRLIIPPELAYGDAGRRPTIPPKATLVFDMELLEIK